MSENLIIGLMTMSGCLAIQCVVAGLMFDILFYLEKNR